MALSATPFLGDDILKHGQELYRQKKYQDALRYFTQAIALKYTVYTALDNRATTYVKLSDHKAALRDGRRMIKMKKDCSIGYLRTGKVLQLLGEDESALGIYRYGISNVHPNDANIELLQIAFNKMVKLSKARDPLTILPLELITMIVKLLSFSNIVELLRVSKLWCSLLSSIPMLWTHLNFSQTDKQVSKPAIRQYIQRSKGTVTRTSIHLSKKHHENALRYITLSCKALVQIDILSGFGKNDLLETVSRALTLKTLIISDKCEIGLDLVSHLLEHCRSLDRAEFHSCNSREFVAWGRNLLKIRSLTINGRDPNSSVDETCLQLPSLLEKIPNIQYLSLKRWHRHFTSAVLSFDFFDFSQSTNLKILSLADCSNVCFPLLPTSVETLDLTGCIYDDTRQDISCARLEATHLPELNVLLIANYHAISAVSLMSLLKPSRGKLKKLSIEACRMLTAMDYAVLIQEGFLSMVSQLNLGSSDVGDDIIEQLATNLQNLRFLDLSCTIVTGIGVKALTLQKNRTLERLNLKNCTSVNIDAVEYARSRGITVDFSFPDPRRR